MNILELCRSRSRSKLCNIFNRWSGINSEWLQLNGCSHESPRHVSHGPYPCFISMIFFSQEILCSWMVVGTLNWSSAGWEYPAPWYRWWSQVSGECVGWWSPCMRWWQMPSPAVPGKPYNIACSCLLIDSILGVVTGRSSCSFAVWSFSHSSGF